MNDETHLFLILVISSTECIRYHLASCLTGAFDLSIKAKQRRKCEHQIPQETVDYELYGSNSIFFLDVFEKGHVTF